MTDEVLSKLLYDFKFHGVKLEKAITILLEGEGLSTHCLKDSKSEDVVQDVAKLLLDYKWNQTKVTKAQYMVDIRSWLKANSDRFKEPTSYDFNFNG